MVLGSAKLLVVGKLWMSAAGAASYSPAIIISFPMSVRAENEILNKTTPRPSWQYYVEATQGQ